MPSSSSSISTKDIQKNKTADFEYDNHPSGDHSDVSNTGGGSKNGNLNNNNHNDNDETMGRSSLQPNVEQLAVDPSSVEECLNLFKACCKKKADFGKSYS